MFIHIICLLTRHQNCFVWWQELKKEMLCFLEKETFKILDSSIVFSNQAMQCSSTTYQFDQVISGESSQVGLVISIVGFRSRVCHSADRDTSFEDSTDESHFSFGMGRRSVDSRGPLASC